MLAPVDDEQLDVSMLFAQTFVDSARLADNIRAVLPPHSSTLLSDILDFYPVEQGAAEILGYLSLTDEDLAVELDETDEMVVDYAAADGGRRRARLPRVTVSRR
jgi:hypothetical protein